MALTPPLTAMAPTGYLAAAAPIGGLVVPLSSTVLVAIREEHARLLRERDRLRNEILKVETESDELEALLRRHGALDAGLSPAGVPALTEAIYRIIAAANRGYRPAEMTHALQGRAYPGAEDGDTFKSLVGNELTELYREQRIGKDKDGRYCALRRAVEKYRPDVDLLEMK